MQSQTHLTCSLQIQFTANVNEWITFKAEVNDAWSVASVNIKIEGCALTGHETRDTIYCPPGHYCKDYCFPTMGENLSKVEATDGRGLQRITGDAHFCIGPCPIHLRSSAEALSNTDALSNIDPEN